MKTAIQPTALQPEPQLLWSCNAASSEVKLGIPEETRSISKKTFDHDDTNGVTERCVAAGEDDGAVGAGVRWPFAVEGRD